MLKVWEDREVEMLKHAFDRALDEKAAEEQKLCQKGFDAETDRLPMAWRRWLAADCAEHVLCQGTPLYSDYVMRAIISARLNALGCTGYEDMRLCDIRNAVFVLMGNDFDGTEDIVSAPAGMEAAWHSVRSNPDSAAWGSASYAEPEWVMRRVAYLQEVLGICGEERGLQLLWDGRCPISWEGEGFF